MTLHTPSKAKQKPAEEDEPEIDESDAQSNDSDGSDEDIDSAEVSTSYSLKFFQFSIYALFLGFRV